MTTLPSGKLSRWRSFTAASFRFWSLTLWSQWLSAGVWLILSWDQSSAPKPKTRSWDCRPPSASVSSSKYRLPTGLDQTRPSMNWWCSQHPTAPTCAALWKSTSQCGGTLPRSISTTMAILFQRCLITIDRPRCQRATPNSMLTGSERKWTGQNTCFHGQIVFKH